MQVSLEDIIVKSMEKEDFLNTFKSKWFYYNQVFGQSTPAYWNQLKKSVLLMSEYIEKKYFEPIIFDVKKGQLGQFLYLRINVNAFPSDEEKILFTKVCRFIAKIEKQLNQENSLDLTPYFVNYAADGSNGLFLSPMFKIN